MVDLLQVPSTPSSLDQAFEAAHAAHTGEVARFVRTVLRSDDEAAEVSAQIWEDVWRGLPSFRREASLRTWIYCIARNACTRHRVRAARRREGSLSEARTSQLVHRDPTTPSPTDSKRARLESLRAELSDDDRALLALRVDRGLPWDEVARVLDTNAPAVRKRFERIKERLRERLRGPERWIRTA